MCLKNGGSSVWNSIENKYFIFYLIYKNTEK